MKRRIVYILGLSRIGSTMLDLVLGSNPRFVGLGEIFQVLRPDMNRFERDEYCSCGNVTHECPFWGTVADRLKKDMSAGLEKRYHHVLDAFEEVFGFGKILVDSSKLLDFLKLVSKSSDIDLKIIYLTRDVRAWTISRLNSRKKSPQYYKRDGYYLKKLRYRYGWKTDIMKWLTPFLTRLPSYYFWLWYLQNKEIVNYLENNNLEYFSLGYDELGMQPDFMMSKIFEFLGEKSGNSSFSSVGSQSHILVGNTKKREAKRRQGIFYDNRWMYQNNWLLASALFPNIMKFNAKEVYRNIKPDSIWEN
jgi:hypothetical protein